MTISGKQHPKIHTTTTNTKNKKDFRVPPKGVVVSEFSFSKVHLSFC